MDNILSPITKNSLIRHFCVYDLEWVPKTYQLRLAGVYDEFKGYRCYRSISDFLFCELTPENNKLWFFAHAGGLSDLQFIIEKLIDQSEYTLTGTLAGSAVIKAQIRRGRFSWMFLDSYWLFREPLRVIAKWVGMQKMGPTEGMTEEEIQEWYRSVPLEQLIPYNENDCRILHKAISEIQLALLESGGQLQTTAGSSALNLFRRKYLKRSINTYGIFNDFVELSYFSSRVENIQVFVGYPGLYYDINSSFPYAMTFPLPGAMLDNFSKTIPDHVWNNPFIVECEIEVPESFLPPLPRRQKDGRIFFPWGRWRGVYTGVDLELLIKQGGKIRRVFKGTSFEEFFDLKQFAENIYTKRKNSKSEFEKAYYKLMINSLYGKFAESPEKQQLIINPARGFFADLDRDMEMIAPGVFAKTVRVPIPHRYLPLSSYITSIARRTLFQYMDSVSEVHYCDTDGFSTVDQLSIGKNLGELKVEKTFDKVWGYLKPKLYAWELKGKVTVKAKGFPKLTLDQFLAMREGQPVTFWRMARVKEVLNQYRKGEGKRPHDIEVTKQLRDTLRSKRFEYPDGFTRPWHVKELE